MERKTDARRNVESAEIGVALTVVHTEVVGFLGVVLVFAVTEHVHAGGLLSREEAERSVIEWRIKRKIERKEFDYEDLLAEYRECGETNSFERQIHDLYLSLLLRHKGTDDSELFSLYTESISLTLFSRTEAFLPKRNLLSKTELLRRFRFFF